MKQLVVFFVLLCFGILSASPLPRWNLIPDSEGNMHLMDLSLQEASVEPLFNAEVDTAFLLLTRRNPTVFQRIFMTQQSIDGSSFNAAHETRFTIHGWNGDSTARVNTFVAFNYLEHGEYNVSCFICPLSSSINY
jgi:pancreatic triacylglycerol lipase